jgi:hypothetical protein
MKAVNRFSNGKQGVRKRARILRERQNRRAVKAAIRKGDDAPIYKPHSILYDIS